MRDLIIITGDLAAGKSTLAASLSEKLSIPYLTKDSLKEIACDAIDYSTREENRKLSVSAMESMIYFFNQSALVGNSLILEANFRSEEVNEIKLIVDEHKYNVMVFYLTGDVNLLYQRFLDRLANRHKAHRSLNLDFSLDRFISYINLIRGQEIPYHIYKINMTDLDEDEVLDEALKAVHQNLGI